MATPLISMQERGGFSVLHSTCSFLSLFSVLNVIEESRVVLRFSFFGVWLREGELRFRARETSARG